MMKTRCKKLITFFGTMAASVMMFGMAALAGDVYNVKVDSGYLALRTAKAYDYNNEIGELYTGQPVEVQDTSDSQYWWVYAPTLGKSGYVNKDYLVRSGLGSATVKVDSGYLALRTAKAFDSANEIGCLYTGETVQIQDTNDSTYWWVYAPSLGRYGYVNKNYLVNINYASGRSVSNSMTVKVDSGYLALRTAKAYAYENEIGELYTGDTVQVYDTSDSTYWWVYSPKHNSYGYVNRDYLVGSSVMTRTVKVDSGYLALRTAKVYDYSNEIGELYTGQTVEVYDTSDSQYWWVYAPSLGRSGYVNKDYLR
ncbi:MAG: hypothetical protein ACI4EI_04000 [Muricoprocola sp.]